jgi:hypothetical protein
MFLYRIRKQVNQIELILGRPLNCTDNENFVSLNSPIDFAFNYQGDLVLLEKVKPYIRVLRSSNNRFDHVNLHMNDMPMNFVSISHYLDGSILVANLASREIVKFKSISLTNDDEQNNGLNIHAADRNEIYVFNRVGQHRSTIDSLTGKFNIDINIIV